MPRTNQVPTCLTAYWRTRFVFKTEEARTAYRTAVLRCVMIDDSDSRNAFFRELSAIVRWYPGYAKQSERPRPAHLLCELEPIERLARKHPNRVGQLAARVRKLRDASACHLASFKVLDAKSELLPGYAANLGRAVDALRGQESRQRPTDAALRGLVYRLALVFHRYYRESDPRKEFRAFVRVMAKTLKINANATTLRAVCREALTAAKREAPRGPAAL